MPHYHLNLHRIISAPRCAAIMLVCFLAMSGELLHASEPYLSNLRAEADFPLYTTYTAAMDRSEYLLDEGYHFRYYTPEQEMEFITDTGGDLGIGFYTGGKFIFRPVDYYQKPVITLSYPDMVRYTAEPIRDLKVTGTFIVHSSHYALLDVALTNLSNEPVSVTLIPYLHEENAGLTDVDRHGKNAVLFSHQELPDGWVVRKHHPFVAGINNVLLTSGSPDRVRTSPGFRSGEVTLPVQKYPGKKPRYQIEGRLENRAGSQKDDAELRYVVIRNGDTSRILMERSHRFGDIRENIHSDGFRVDLGNFGQIQRGDVFTILVFSPVSGRAGLVTDTVGNMPQPGPHRLSVSLNETLRQGAVPRVSRKPELENGQITLSTEGDTSGPFRVYRRRYPEQGFYEHVGMVAGGGKFSATIPGQTGGEVYEYLIAQESEHPGLFLISQPVNTLPEQDFITSLVAGETDDPLLDVAGVIALETDLIIQPGEGSSFRIIRGVGRQSVPRDTLIENARSLLSADPGEYIEANERLFSRLPRPDFPSEEFEALYWSAYNMMRQVMMPPEGHCGYNHYVYSREPTWGWGHAGQVFHESLTMLPYVLLDPESAMNSQRVYHERQHADGYIAYRIGPYFEAINPNNRQLTTSAPWYNYINRALYEITGDREFLREMYSSGKAFYQYLMRNRDSDGDGLYEWGGRGVLESVRDALVAVWRNVGHPQHFEAVGLNTMMVMESDALAGMARNLGRNGEAEKWEEHSSALRNRINANLWDEETGFYYHVDKRDNDFTFTRKNDLKRQEIVGLLPLWAGIPSAEQADRLVKILTDSSKFWRRYGIPSLAADDPFYNPQGYWNGPVWVEWNYLIMRGLQKYGYRKEARELTRRVAANMVDRLKKDHTLWEFYSPDESWGGHHHTYIWAGMINSMLLESVVEE